MKKRFGFVSNSSSSSFVVVGYSITKDEAIEIIESSFNEKSIKEMIDTVNDDMGKEYKKLKDFKLEDIIYLDEDISLEYIAGLHEKKKLYLGSKFSGSGYENISLTELMRNLKIKYSRFIGHKDFELIAGTEWS